MLKYGLLPLLRHYLCCRPIAQSFSRTPHCTVLDSIRWNFPYHKRTYRSSKTVPWDRIQWNTYTERQKVPKGGNKKECTTLISWSLEGCFKSNPKLSPMGCEDTTPDLGLRPQTVFPGRNFLPGWQQLVFFLSSRWKGEGTYLLFLQTHT
jgi:hypothetical protein